MIRLTTVEQPLCHQTFQDPVPVRKAVDPLRQPTSCLDARLEKEVDQMKVATGMSIPVLPALHTKSNGRWRGIRTRVLTGGVLSSIVGSEGLAGNDAMREGTTSEVGVVLERHDEDDENSSWTTNFFYPLRSRTIPEVV